MKVRVFIPMEIEPKDDAASVSSAGSAESADSVESVTSLMESFKESMKEVQAMTKSVTKQMNSLFKRAKAETVDWMQEPLCPTPPVLAWCKAHGLSDTPTIDEFLEAVFAAAMTMDYETRVLTFRKDDALALWKGTYSLTMFDVIGRLPTLFL
jgi:hypothetical protein